MPKQQNTPDQDIVSRLYGVVDTIAAAPSSAAPGGGKKLATPAKKTIDITQEIARERKIRNDDAEQNIQLKRVTLNRLFWFLGIETALIFLMALLQGTGWLGFALEEWSFNVLIGATIAQITAMLFAAVQYLFPKKENSDGK